MAIRVSNLTHQILSVPGPINEILSERQVKDYEFIEYDSVINTAATKDLIDKGLISVVDTDPIPPGSSDDLQKAYDNSPSGNRTIALAAGANEGINIRDNAAPIGTPLFQVTDSAGATPYLRSEVGHNFLSGYTTVDSPVVLQGSYNGDQFWMSAALEARRKSAGPWASTGINLQAVPGAGTGWAFGIYGGAQTDPGDDQAAKILVGVEAYSGFLGINNGFASYGSRSFATIESGTSNFLVGSYTSTTPSNAGVTVGSAFGVQSEVLSADNAVTTAGHCFRADSYTWGGGSITSVSGYTCEELVSATNNTNLLLGTTTIPAGNFNQYNASTRKNYFNGPIDLNNSLQLPTNSTALNYTILDADGYFTVLGTGGAGGIQIDLPLAANNPGRVIAVKKVDAGAGAVTVAAQGANTVDGAASQSLGSQWDKMLFQSDGTNWYVIG